jgi:hypothetical protein
VILPVLFLPHELFNDFTRDFSGPFLVISLKSYPIMKRLEGVRGLYVFTAILSIILNGK